MSADAIFYAACGAVLAATAVVCVWRIAAGPTVLDRVVGSELVTGCVIAALALYTDATASTYAAVSMLGLTALSFLGSVSVARFIPREDREGVRPDLALAPVALLILDGFGYAAISVGVLVTLVAAIGLIRFPDVLTRMHAVSKPQMFGLLLILAGTVAHARDGRIAAMLALVLLAQILTVPVSSTMIGRAAFRRGFADRAALVHDELTPRLAGQVDRDEDEDGFKDDETIPEAAVPEHQNVIELDPDHRLEENWEPDESEDE